MSEPRRLQLACVSRAPESRPLDTTANIIKPLRYAELAFGCPALTNWCSSPTPREKPNQLKQEQKPRRQNLRTYSSLLPMYRFLLPMHIVYGSTYSARHMCHTQWLPDVSMNDIIICWCASPSFHSCAYACDYKLIVLVVKSSIGKSINKAFI